MDNLRIIIAGMGKMGKIRAAQVQAHPNTSLVGVFDINPDNLDAFQCTVCSSFEDLLDIPADAIFICTFNDIAPKYTTQSLERGLHVFCEKPPGRNVQDIKDVMEVEKRNDQLVLKYGFNHRYHYSVMEAKKLVDSGIYGKLLWLNGVYGKAGGNKFAENWRSNKDKAGGGILLDQGIHMLDLIRYFGGDFHNCKSVIRTLYWPVQMEDNAFVILEGNEGRVAMMHSSSTQWKHKFLLEMCFEDGYINLNGILSSTRSYGDETIVMARRQFEDSAFAMGKPREEMIYFDTDDSWKLELQEFVDAVLNDKSIENGTSADALQVMQLIEEIYRNSK